MKSKRRVWVIGAGPGGLTAAFEAARLGHRVTLFEQEKETGGQLRYAEKAPYKAVYGKWVRTLTDKCRKAGVEIRTGTAVTEEMISAGKPDAVVLAIGADKASCPAKGINASVVCDAWQVLSGEVAPGKNVLVVGGGLVGMEAADFLCEKGVRTLTLVEMLPDPPVPPVRAHGTMLHRRLGEAGAKLLFGTAVKEIRERSVIVTAGGEERTIEPVDQVIIAVGVTPRQDLKAFLEKQGIRHFIIGDTKEPRRIIESTEEGAKAAWEI